MAQWTTGDTITAEKLNMASILVANVIEEYDSQFGDTISRLDKTWQEIYDAACCFIVFEDDDTKGIDRVRFLSSLNNNYSITTNQTGYNCSNPNDYPIETGGK